MPTNSKTNNKFFRFEKKFGWGEMFAFIAILISGWGIIEGRRATTSSVQIVRHTPTPLYLADQNHDALIAACFSLTVSNRGGIGVSITGIGDSENIQPVTTSTNGEYDTNPKLANRFFVSNLVPQKLTDNSGFVAAVDFLSDAERKRKVVPIPSGETRNITVGILVDAYEVLNPLVETVLVSLEVQFDDGSSYPLRAEFSTRNIGGQFKQIHIEEPLVTFVPPREDAR